MPTDPGSLSSERPMSRQSQESAVHSVSGGRPGSIGIPAPGQGYGRGGMQDGASLASQDRDDVSVSSALLLQPGKDAEVVGGRQDPVHGVGSPGATSALQRAEAERAFSIGSASTDGSSVGAQSMSGRSIAYRLPRPGGHGGSVEGGSAGGQSAALLGSDHGSSASQSNGSSGDQS